MNNPEIVNLAFEYELKDRREKFKDLELNRLRKLENEFRRITELFEIISYEDVMTNELVIRICKLDLVASKTFKEAVEMALQRETKNANG